MTILFTTTYYTPYVSGLTILVKRLAEAFAKDHSVCVLTTQFEKALKTGEEMSNVLVVRIPYLFRVNKGFFMPSYFSEVWKRIAKAEAIVINMPQFEGVIPAIIGRIYRKKVICIYNCEVALPKGLANHLIEFFLHMSHFFTLSLANTIVTYTKDYGNHTLLLPFFKKKLHYIYPPIPVPNVNKHAKEELRAKIPKRKYYIGVAARIAAEKGMEYLFEAIPILKRKLKSSFAILIAGPKKPVGEKAYLQKLQPLLTQYKAEIIFLGTISQEEMGAFYSLLDVLVLPSVNKTEAFGMVQVEAMLCGVPVIASDLPGVRIPIQKTGMGELAKPNDSIGLAKKITTVLFNKKLYQKKKAVIKKEFSVDHSLNAYEAIVF
ncbi:MAG: glycosyltransferase family 4 protein [Candidatus Levybacteria bacterium]|nr:glycosyltransferase family 4 protein [Candidatus Levybacteria bacterium]